MKFTTVFSALFAAAASVSAAPLSKQARDVWDPKMTFPSAGTVLQSGKTYTVTWETADQPAEITNPNGFILLQTGEVQGPLVLAHDFDIRDGEVSITVPEVLTASDYHLVLFGDSGNSGPACWLLLLSRS